jgi:hypothetical protein
VEVAHRPEVERHGHFWLEVAIAAVLGLTAVATAFSAYRAGKSERATVAHYNEGIRDSSVSTGVLLEAEQTLGSDQAIFLEYAKAAQQDNLELAAYLLNNLMSKNLRAAVLWWSEGDRSDKYKSPFVDANPKYDRSGFEIGNHLSDRSNKLFAQAQKTHKTSNRYDLVTVILAAALFMLGLAGVLRHHGLRLAFFGIGLLFFLGGAIQILRIAVF